MKEWDEKAFVGGHPVLDFINTVEDVDKSRTISRIARWPEFCAWANASTMFNSEQLNGLKDLAKQTDTSVILQRLHRLRELQYQALARIAAGEGGQEAELTELEVAIRQALQRSHLQAAEAGYLWQPDLNHEDWVSDLLLLSLEHLLRSGQLARLKQCGRCSWLFLNKGRGKGRRWCDMSTCGNRAKLESFRNKEH
ncbi:CGNR zinc finger domain-containing protein [Marinobacterium jannaschii]|uniref:CGNR zinc finger domain-containing protein n=1 Tax=Marinobacterium jannaschii TaxID=64970 RepID=UPI00056C9DAE|nr:CGNR zinc finger domain-containing protein [Marinobacterium jannaschii]